MKSILRLIPSVLFLSFCQNRSVLSQQQNQTITGDITSLLNNYFAAIKASGLNAEFNYLDSSKDFYWKPPGYSSAIDFDSVSRILKQNAASLKLVDNSFDSLKIKIISPDSASYTAYIKSLIIDTSGKTSKMYLFEKGKLIKRKKGWKLLSGETALLRTKE